MSAARGSSLRRLLRGTLVLLALALAARLAWLVETSLPVRSAVAPPEELVILPGASADQIARELHARGLVRHPLLFKAFVHARGVGGSLKAGDYRLEGPLSLEQIVDAMVRGDVVRREVTVPEGRNLVEVAELLAPHGIEPAAFLAAARDPAPIRDLDAEAEDLEGYLFPDTYDLPRISDPAPALVARMVQRFRGVIEAERARLEERELTLRQVVTLASIVELETGRADERARIAAVFHNRLHRTMLLQADPTVVFAMRLAGEWQGNIRKRDLEIDSPYNTYRYRGLPPGPIASPGRDAILAVLNPDDVKDLYFVSRNDGSHHFSETLAEHNRAVDLYQRRRVRPAAPVGRP